MRNSMSNEEVAHEFASIEPNLNAYSGSMSLGRMYRGHRDNTGLIGLYSYSTFIALRDEEKNIFLISRRSYSNTTNRHQTHLWNATRGYNRITVYDVNASDINNVKYSLDLVKEYARKHVKARKNSYEEDILHELSQLALFLDYAQLDKRKTLTKRAYRVIEASKGDFTDFLNMVLELSEEEQKEAQRAEKRRIRAIRLKNQELISSINNERLNNVLKDRKEAFINGDTEELKYYDVTNEYRRLADIIERFKLESFEWFLNHQDLLRITDKCNVITSQRVTFSKQDAIKLYKALKVGAIKAGQTVLNWRCNKVTSGYISVGCHRLAIIDIEEAYKTLTGCKDA